MVLVVGWFWYDKAPIRKAGLGRQIRENRQEKAGTSCNADLLIYLK